MNIRKTPAVPFLSIYRNSFLLACFLLSAVATYAQGQSAPTSIMQDLNYPFMEKLVQIAKENYPRVKSFDTRIDVAGVDVTKAKINFIDILSFSFIYNPNYTFNVLNPTYFQGIQVNLSFNMASLATKPSNVKQAKLNKRIAQYDRDEYMLQLETQVKAAYVSFIRAQRNAIYQTTSLNNTLEVMTNAEKKYRDTEITNDVYIQTLSTYNAAVSAKMDAEVALLNARFTLESYLGGRKIEEVK